MEQANTWTVTVQLTVFAGDMEKHDVISNADCLLHEALDGTDVASYSIVSAERDEI